MTQYCDSLIVGGGISGLLTARELAMAGLSVTILEKSAIGQESSWAGGGILLPIYPWRQPEAISTLVMASLASYPNLSRELHDATGIDPEWQPCGMLICKNPDHDTARRWCREHDIEHSTPPPSLLASFDTDYDHPLWLPEVAQARNPRLLKSLQAFLRQRGVNLIEHCNLIGLETQGRQITALNTTSQRYVFSHLIVCAGAWTAPVLQHCLPGSPWAPAVAPVRGQMLLFDAEPDTLACMVLDGAHYLIPRRDGKILAGSSVEHTGFDKRTTTDIRQHLEHFATRLLPALQHYPISHHWAGLRPGSPQGIPSIGFHPDFDNLSVNVGHFRNGLVMGPASARLLADLILKRPPLLDPAPYATSLKSIDQV
ncbi:MAG: FAD-dependent oxidoreductase [Methylomonas sp.]|nr:FAD-dependent oxidoreductase [Methylomonas sp.]PPD21697.1 MAG: FAD-dependent oxidoreductase [Methylomonas sp.]PPD25762.1 MAG: FAD-dependent oxidoreductase [Methylomonas sp.]PPD37009.1 MAG: FAD-dependent oxidoreductase [Methylomonas sp.]PPD40671.1 MAG: FAD-dependent oxidoreductase [Methylomonas sp.]